MSSRYSKAQVTVRIKKNRLSLLVISTSVVILAYFVRGWLLIGPIFANNPPPQSLAITIAIVIATAVLSLSLLALVATLYLLAWMSQHRVLWLAVLTTLIVAIVLGVAWSNYSQTRADSQACKQAREENGFVPRTLGIGDRVILCADY